LDPYQTTAIRFLDDEQKTRSGAAAVCREEVEKEEVAELLFGNIARHNDQNIFLLFGCRCRLHFDGMRSRVVVLSISVPVMLF
jgi:hypothetical protein